MDSHELYERLNGLGDLNALREIFAKLNYDYEDSPVPTSQWSDRAKESFNDARVIAKHKDFAVLYFEINRLLLTQERLIVDQALRSFPYSLIVFHSSEEEKWHFVNIKFDKNEPQRKLTRRYSIGEGERLRTTSERLALIKVEDETISPLELQLKHDKAFDVEAVTKAFFDTYKQILERLKDELTAQLPDATVQHTQAFAQQFLNRLMFLYFVQKKKWLTWNVSESDPMYIKHLFENYERLNPGSNERDSSGFYNQWLTSLFFSAFNKLFDFQNRELPAEVKESLSSMPFFNGGLFTKNEFDEMGFSITDSTFSYILDELLERFNFTVSEETPIDVEVAVDPEMLGKVYESLVFNEERHAGGIFYTPRVEIDLMCKLSLIEYLHSEPSLPKEKLIDLIMNAYEETPLPFTAQELNPIINCLKKVRVVDPAVGSGSFLVYMMNLLISLLRKIAHHTSTPFNGYAEKKRIVSDNLFGVDVKDWAVKVAELRLWLSLIIESGASEMDRYTNPILPNLSYKIRQGDSLVEEIDGTSFSLRGDFSAIGAEVAKKISLLGEKKAAFFRGDTSVTKAEIDYLEHSILDGVVRGKIKRLVEEIAGLDKSVFEDEAEQTQMWELSAKQMKLKADKSAKEQKRREKKKEDLEDQRRRLAQLLVALEQKKTKDYFLWDIDFAEVFREKGGFDIVIANPPYVRQEQIAWPLDNADDYSADDFRERKKAYKEALERSVKAHWNKAKIDKKSDLYIYFYYHSLALLKKGGIFCYINSNSWLDVGYGVKLQEFILGNVDAKLIIDNHAKRSFKDADVNTVIVLLKRPASPVTAKTSPVILREGRQTSPTEESPALGSNLVKFVAFKTPFENVSNQETILEIEKAQEVTKTDAFRVYPITQAKLLEDGIEKAAEEELHANIGTYVGNKWGGKYLRAPDIFFRILEKGKGKLVRLGDIAEVRRGFTTGCNEFFYLPSKHFDLEHDKSASIYHLIPKHDGLPDDLAIEEEFLKIGIQKVEELTALHVSRAIKKLFLPSAANLDDFPYAQKYIRWGETEKINLTQTCRVRSNWFSIINEDGKSPSNLGFNYNIYDTGWFYYSSKPIYFSDNFHMIYSKHNKVISAIGNSSFFALMINILGRTMFGGGKLKLQTYELARMPFIDINQLNSDQIKLLEEGWSKMSNRSPINLFDDFGIDSDTFKTSKKLSVVPDRQAIDKIIFDYIGLNDDERKQVYFSTVGILKDRLMRAESV